MHLPCAAPCGGLACGGWRPALDSDVGVPRNELASSSPCGDERAAGPTRFFIARARFEFSRSRVFIASFGRRGRPSPLQLRATCCRIRLRLFRQAATSVLRGLPAFYRSGAFCTFPALFHVALGLRGRWGWLRHRGPGGGWHLRQPPRRQGGGSALCGCFLSPPAWVEVHLAASQCWKTVRVRPAVCSLMLLVGSQCLVSCCTLRAVGWRCCVARGPSSCGGRGTS